MPPITRYAKSGDVHVAYQVFGEGTVNLDDRFHEPDHGTGDLLVDSSFAVR